MNDGGRGKRGGLSEYARMVGRDERLLRMYRDAAEVVSAINLGNISEVLDRTHHLAAIHAMPTFESALQ